MDHALVFKNKFFGVGHFAEKGRFMEESTSHQQLGQGAELAQRNLTQLCEERLRLVQRLRDVEQSISGLQELIESIEQAAPGKDSLAVQLQRIDQELRAIDGAKPGSGRTPYTGVERRVTPRPTTVLTPLATLPARIGAPRAPAGVLAGGAMLERARRMLQTGRDRSA